MEIALLVWRAMARPCIFSVLKAKLRLEVCANVGLRQHCCQEHVSQLCVPGLECTLTQAVERAKIARLRRLRLPYPSRGFWA